ncbi:MAG: T9SS type A sorting domain-containing protein [Bacteroidota bacterium]
MKGLIISIILIILPFCLDAQGLIIHSGTHLKGSNNANVVIGSGSWTNNGSFTHQNATVHFTGSAEQQIEGSSSSSFYNLNVNKSGGDLTLGTNINVDNELQMNGGDLDLRNSTADLGTTGMIIDETETNRVKVGDINANTGTIQATRTINNVSAYDPGNLGVLITTPNDLGSTTVVRGHQVQLGIGTYSSNESIARYIQVPGIGKLESGVNVEMQYWDTELNGHIPSELEVYQWVKESAEEWWTPLAGSVNTTNNLFSPANEPYSDYFDEPNWYPLDFTDKFTMGSENIPLPIELIKFDGACQDNTVTLEWKTASETNNEIFIIQRSPDGNDFVDIGSVDGSGNTNQLSEYQYDDTEPLINAYYRFKQVDFDGTYEYSPIINISCVDVDEPVFSVYPNPFRDVLHVEAGNMPDHLCHLKIYSMDGRLIDNFQIEAPANGFHEILYLDNLVPAMYMIRIISGDFVKTYKIDKE